MSDTTKPSGAEILDNLQGVMSDAQMGRGDLTYIGAPKSIKRERDLSAYNAVAALIASNAEIEAQVNALVAINDLQSATNASLCDEFAKLHGLAAKAFAERDALLAERDALRASLLSIHSAAVHHFSSCHPGPFKRMPPELRAAIAAATAPTQDKAND